MYIYKDVTAFHFAPLRSMFVKIYKQFRKNHRKIKVNYQQLFLPRAPFSTRPHPMWKRMKLFPVDGPTEPHLLAVHHTEMIVNPGKSKQTKLHHFGHASSPSLKCSFRSRTPGWEGFGS